MKNVEMFGSETFNVINLTAPEMAPIAAIVARAEAIAPKARSRIGRVVGM